MRSKRLRTRSGKAGSASLACSCSTRSSSSPTGAPDEVASAGPALDDLLLALVQDAGVPAEQQTPAVETVKQALDAVTRRSVLAPARHPWKRFASDVRSALGLTQAEVDKPLCNDRQVIKKADVDAVGVTVDFYTDATPAEMSVCDPTRWHECTAAFDPMQPWKGAGAVDEQRPNGWRRDLIERVDFLPGTAPLTTPLRFTYSIDDGPDPAWTHLDYVLIEETDHIAVDEGSIDVRRVSTGEHSGRTRVSTKKLIGFKDKTLASWTTVACDTFWTELVVNAAVGCLGGAQADKPNVNGGTAVHEPETKAAQRSNRGGRRGGARIDRRLQRARQAGGLPAQRWRPGRQRGLAAADDEGLQPGTRRRCEELDDLHRDARCPRRVSDAGLGIDEVEPDIQAASRPS